MAITAEDVYRVAPFARTLGVVFDELAPGPLTTRLPFDASLSTTHGGLHGGALMGLADVTAAVCAVLNGPAGTSAATVDSSTHFLGAVRGDARAIATPLHIGRGFVVVGVDIADRDDVLRVRVTQTVALRPTGAAPSAVPGGRTT